MLESIKGFLFSFAILFIFFVIVALLLNSQVFQLLSFVIYHFNVGSVIFLGGFLHTDTILLFQGSLYILIIIFLLKVFLPFLKTN